MEKSVGILMGQSNADMNSCTRHKNISCEINAVTVEKGKIEMRWDIFSAQNNMHNWE